MCAGEDFSRDDASLVKDVVDAGAVARQAARVREVLWIIDGGHAKARRQRGDLLVVRGEERLRVDDHTRRLLLSDRSECRIEVALARYWHNHDASPQRFAGATRRLLQPCRLRVGIE